MNLIGIGIDLVDLHRFAGLYGSRDPDVLGRCFSAQEQGDAGCGQDSLCRLAARFAAKEAVLKVLEGLQEGIALTDIEVCLSPSGKPMIKLSGGALAKAEADGIDQWFLSLTHTEATAAAVAVAVSLAPA